VTAIPNSVNVVGRWKLDIKRRPPDDYEMQEMNDIIYRRNVELKDAVSKSGGKLRA
jgi:hypothetical protein